MSGADRRHQDGPDPRFFSPLFVAGFGVMAFGVAGLLGDERLEPLPVARWVVGLAVVHDLLVVPIVIAVTVVVLRRVRPPYRAIASGAAMVSGVVVAYAWPSLRRYGELANNPTILPRDYAQGLAVVLAIVWSGAAVLMLLARRRATATS